VGVEKIKTLGLCPKPRHFLKKVDKNFNVKSFLLLFFKKEVGFGVKP